MLGSDIDQCTFNVLGHPLGIAADIDVGTFGKPCPEIATDLAQIWIVLLAIALGSGTSTARAADVNDAPSLEQRRDERQTTVDEVSRGVMLRGSLPTVPSSSPKAAISRARGSEPLDM